MAAQRAKTINIIRGKSLVDQATQDDVKLLLEHIDALESAMDEAEGTDVFGTEGWRHMLSID